MAKPAARSTHPSPPPRTRARRAALWAALLAVPVLLLGGTEAALRAAGYGVTPEPLFVPAPGQTEYLQANPRAILRLVPDASQAPGVSIETSYFRTTKRPGSLRVFVQGESSAAGFPYGLGASLAGVLDQRLERVFPGREVEVVSTAMSAVTTYALLDFADDIIAQQPDAVVIYAGHNEYLGVLGVGSTFRAASSPRLTRLALAARNWRLYQWVSNVVRRVSPAAPAVTASSSDTLMARVAAEREIPFDSRLYWAGLDQFQHNLDALLGRYRAARIPVFIGTLVSNERDQAPFVSVASEGEQSASAHYERGKVRESARDYVAARAEFAAARDRDALRFRAPGAMNDIVRDAAASQGATVVDSQAAFAAASPEGLIGNTLLLEHVHPNLDGYFLLADAFFDALLASGVAGVPAVQLDDAAAKREMPVSAVDRWLGEYKLLRIKSAWPFVAQSRTPSLPAPQSVAENLARQVYDGTLSWLDAQQQLLANYALSDDGVERARVATILADAFPFVAPLQFETAEALAAIGRVADARRYAARTLEVDPNNAAAQARSREWAAHATETN